MTPQFKLGLKASAPRRDKHDFPEIASGHCWMDSEPWELLEMSAELSRCFANMLKGFEPSPKSQMF